MNYYHLMRAGLLGASCLTLSACLGSSNGGLGGAGGSGGGAAATISDFDAKFDSLTTTTTLAPTSVELTGQGTFKGSTKLNVFEAANTANSGTALGDLTVVADFDAETISGTATNFRGELGGEAFTLDGTLDSANSAIPSTLTEMTTPIPPLPGGAIPGAPTSVTTNAYAVNMAGQLSDPVSGSIGDVNLGIGGAFLGPVGGGQAQAAVGPATVVVTNVPGTVGIGIGGGGTFYLERE